jgi:hypothetical protein
MKFLGKNKYHKREITTLALSIVIIGAIFMPYPDISAVQVKLTHRNTTDDSKGMDLQVVAQDPSKITFGDGLRSETIPFGQIKVTLDHGTINEKSAIFNFTGGMISDSSGGIIKGLTFSGITHHHKPGTFGTGNFYGYGKGFFSGNFTKGEIGDGSNVTGISSQQYGQDTIASYHVNFNPHLLSVGKHMIRVDVIAHPGDANFFSTGDVQFNNHPDKDDKKDKDDKNTKDNDKKSGTGDDDKSNATNNNNKPNDTSNNNKPNDTSNNNKPNDTSNNNKPNDTSNNNKPNDTSNNNKSDDNKSSNTGNSNKPNNKNSK